MHRFFLSLWFMLSTTGALAAVSASADLVTRLNHIQSLQTRFVQRVLTSKGQIKTTSAGQLVLVRPGRFRWTVTKPAEQIIVADGQRLWVYDPDLAQVSVQPQRTGVQNRPALLLSGHAEQVIQGYQVKRVKTQPGLSVFNLTAQSKSQAFTDVMFVFTQNQLAEMRFNDNLGHTVQLIFIHPTVNQPIDTQLLRFTPPAGVDVVQQSAPGAS